MRFFNTAGPIRRDRHYHVPPLERLDADDVRLLIRQWKYFVLHAPRQTGKTSALLELRDQLNAAGEVCCDYVNVEVGQTALIRSHGASGWRKDSRSVACAKGRVSACRYGRGRTTTRPPSTTSTVSSQPWSRDMPMSGSQSTSSTETRLERPFQTTVVS